MLIFFYTLDIQDVCSSVIKLYDTLPWRRVLEVNIFLDL